MKKAWSVITGIVLVSILLGGICIAVGYVTGGSTEAILTGWSCATISAPIVTPISPTCSSS